MQERKYWQGARTLAATLALAALLPATQAAAQSTAEFPGEAAASEIMDFRSMHGLAFEDRAALLSLSWDERGIQPGGREPVSRVISQAIAVPLEEARPFLAVAPVLAGRFPAHSLVEVEIRGSSDGVAWGEWFDASHHGHGDDDPGHELMRAMPGLPGVGDESLPGELVFFDADTRFVQYRLSLIRDFHGTAPIVGELALHFISPGETRGELETQSLPDQRPATAAPQAAMPNYVPRSSWGNLSNTGWLSLASVSQLVVHHTVSPNSSNDWAATVRSFYNYHVHTLGWADIGYNWLVAPNGAIFQGRAHRPDGNTNVRGAHAAGHNSYTMGLAYIGTYTSVNPTSAAVESGARVLAWKAAERGISTSLIRGHRDYGSTACPGNMLYNRLFDTLRPRVQQILDGDSAPEPEPPFDTLWHRADAVNANPWYFGNNAQRGLAFGGDRIYVVSRHSEQWGPHVMVHSAADGSGLGNGGASLDTSGIAGGTLVLNAIDSDASGRPLAANLVTDLSQQRFRAYYWPDDASEPLRVVDFSGQSAHRLGDHIAVRGSVVDGTAEIWAPASGVPVIYRWTMNGDGFNHWPQAIHLSDGVVGTSAAVAPLENGRFLWNATGQHLRLYEGNGALLGTVPGGIVARDSNAVRLLGRDGDDLWAAVYQFGSSNENARIVRIPESNPAGAGSLGVTTSLAANSNPNASGDIAVRRNQGSVDVFVLASNNGLGAYRFAQLDLSSAQDDAPRHEEVDAVEPAGHAPREPISVAPPIATPVDAASGGVEHSPALMDLELNQ
ncbi:N-acetylmuramoyl-L-alanine amidase [Natronospira bacteriovora]|uniref:N-acetylmuramoyl-L-alanine amidase n=1 Tax=Natronospira bacteriovora TaxID=3069753 RepID=A0ABU0W516_9GAMM|nr:N-acetylmuramoyl-L-alanine amidase [Natronospira sp. AB-CW4]MDQ2069091.1 N-acetylmuramoyl-L-alanine amidase [Natronospira sp. AB-CW4]